MDFAVVLFILVVYGLFVGAFARLALPGKDPMSIWQTMAIGIGGSLIAGVISIPLLGRYPGFLLSLICSAAIVYFIRRSRGGGLTNPGAPPIDR